MPIAIILPVIALVLLTAIVWLRLYGERISELRQSRIDPQSLATSDLTAQTMQRVQASDNFKNLFEVPVLFYALCAILASAQYVSPFFVIGAWLYVALRYVHSCIHLTCNRVMHRFAVYVLTRAILFLLWAVCGVQVLHLSVAANRTSTAAREPHAPRAVRPGGSERRSRPPPALRRAATRRNSRCRCPSGRRGCRCRRRPGPVSRMHSRFAHSRARSVSIARCRP